MPKQGEPKKKGLSREAARDAIGVLGLVAITAGAGLQFGIPVGLMVFGAFVLLFVAYDLWAAD